MLIVTFGLGLQWKLHTLHACARTFAELVSGESVADVIAVVRASRGAQSTVDGFYAIHTKLTDSVECSPRQAARRQ